MASSKRRLGRRGLLRGVGIASGIAVTGSAAVHVGRNVIAHGQDVTTTTRPSYTGTHRPAAESAASLAADAAEYLGLAAGTRLDRWTVIAARGPHLGAIALVLAGPDGEQFQVDVLKRTDATSAAAIASTPSVEVYLSNRGDGRTATVEEHGLAAMAVGAHLAARESAGARAPDLLTRDERRTRHPLGAYRIAV